MATLNNQMVEVKNEHKYDRDLCKPHEVDHSSLTKWWEAEKARHLIPIWPWLDTGHFLSKHFIFIPTTENTQKNPWQFQTQVSYGLLLFCSIFFPISHLHSRKISSGSFLQVAPMTVTKSTDGLSTCAQLSAPGTYCPGDAWLSESP